MSEEGFHEIQLNGKQLVFLFMTVTVVSVVIFLCGVLVGRGVRGERADAAVDSAVAPIPATPEPAATMADAGAGTQAAAATTDPATAAPPPADDELSYYKRLEGDSAPKETLQPVPQTAPPVPQTAPPPPPAAPPPATASATSAASVPSASSAGGIAVQIAALRDRNEADSLVRKLNAKGYNTYVVNAPAGAAMTYKVRVGNFKTEREAEDAKVRLEKEEQFKPWIVR